MSYTSTFKITDSNFFNVEYRVGKFATLTRAYCSLEVAAKATAFANCDSDWAMENIRQTKEVVLDELVEMVYANGFLAGLEELEHRWNRGILTNIEFFSMVAQAMTDLLLQNQ
jgi:hypothetical protein